MGVWKGGARGPGRGWGNGGMWGDGSWFRREGERLGIRIRREGGGDEKAWKHGSTRCEEEGAVWYLR